MKNILWSTVSLTLIFLWLLPNQVGASEPDPEKLIAALNAKTAEIKYNWVVKNKAGEIASSHHEVDSYVFSLKDKILGIEFTGEIRSFTKGKYTDTNRSFGKISMDTAHLDQKKTALSDEWIKIVCRDKKECMNHELRLTEHNAKGEKTYQKSIKSPVSRFLIKVGDQSIAEQILKDLQKLFSLLVPPPKPAGKTVSGAVVKKQR